MIHETWRAYFMAKCIVNGPSCGGGGRFFAYPFPYRDIPSYIACAIDPTAVRRPNKHIRPCCIAWLAAHGKRLAGRVNKHRWRIHQPTASSSSSTCNSSFSVNTCLLMHCWHMNKITKFNTHTRVRSVHATLPRTHMWCGIIVIRGIYMFVQYSVAKDCQTHRSCNEWWRWFSCIQPLLRKSWKCSR